MIPKRVAYVPGLISLIGLPIILILFGPEDKVQQTSLKCIMPSDDLHVSDTSFTKGNVLKSVRNCKIEEVDLWSNVWDNIQSDMGNYTDDKQHELVISEIERLQFTHDTTTVLKVQLSEGNTYGEFVWLTNLALIYRIKRYAFVDDAFYFLTNEPPIDYSRIPVDPLILDNSSMILDPSYKPPTAWDIFIRNIEYKIDEYSYYIKNNLLLSISFLILIIIPSISRLSKSKSAHTKKLQLT
jgi:hypothetical protein